MAKMLTVSQALTSAALAYNAGKLDEAEHLCHRILSADHDCFGALHLLALVQLRLDKRQHALASCDIVLSIRPDEAEALANRGIIMHKLKRFEEALASYDRALAVRPGWADTLYNRGIALVELKAPGKAVASYDRAIALQPSYAAALYSRGSTLHELGQFRDALTSYDRALALQPDYTEALSNRGCTLHELRRFGEALASCDRALCLRPDSVEALCNRANTLHEFKRFEDGLSCYDRALAVRPDHPFALSNRGNTLYELNKFEQSLASCRRALVLKPDLASAYSNMGLALKVMGQLEEARQAFAKAIVIDANLINVYFHLADSTTFVAGHPHLAMMEELAAKTEQSNPDRFQLDFALAKAYADINDHRRSFQHLLSGNAAKRASISYDEKSALARFDRITAAFTPAVIAAKSGMGHPSTRPIFIIGMPRSGTTLIEQIIASHPLVYAAGESSVLGEVVRAIRGPDGNALDYPEFVPALSAPALRQIGTHYVAAVGKFAPQDRYITDKMPSNYFFAGLVHLALPNAKIIHAVRDPIDTCLSCFSKPFAGLHHTHDLGEIGRYYKRYRRLMEHWHEVLPVGRILQVRYEDVVTNLERETRRIITHCGLDWDERCLAFERTQRPVRTVSATQVRLPVYETAVGRWRLYEPFLGPLFAALGDEIK